MERQFRINWGAIVEEARQRRKAQKLSQQTLAQLAGVSTPTISHFENGMRDVQLSSVTRILGVLGMLDKRVLDFPDPAPRYDPDRMIVSFKGQDGDRNISCAISEEALEDHFDDATAGPTKTFRANRERIEHEARRKYLADNLEADGSVLIRSGDL